MAIQSIGFTKWSNPKQATDATIVNQQMQRVLNLHSQFGKPLQGEDVRTTIVLVATMAEALQLLEL